MDSDSPVNTRIAGQPILNLGTRFTAGNPRKPFTWTRRAVRGFDSVRRTPGYHGSPASYRVPVGQGYHP
jgi:hypothetical protein